MLLDDVKALHDAAVETIVTCARAGEHEPKDYDRLFDAAFSLSDFIVDTGGQAGVDPHELRRLSNIYTVKKVLWVLRERDIHIDRAGFPAASRVAGRYRQALDDLLTDFRVDGMLEVAPRSAPRAAA